MSSTEAVAPAAAMPPAAPAAEDPQDQRLRGLTFAGGALHQIARRLGLVRDGSNSIGLGIALGGSVWILLVLIAALTGRLPEMFSPGVIAAHVRLLLVLPAFFVCETWFDPAARRFIYSLVAAGVIPTSQRPALGRLIAQLSRVRDSWVPDSLSLLAAIAFWIAGTRAVHFGGAPSDDNIAALRGSLLMIVHFAVAVTLFRFILFRFLFRYGLWCWFLWRLSRLELHLVAVHPDRAAGLGTAEIVQFQLTPFIFGFSALLSATLAEELATGSAIFSIVYPAAALAALAGVIFAYGPISVFVPNLVRCRHAGFSAYMTLASRYVTSFERKWIGGESSEELLGTADLQSLADLSNSVSIVREMHIVPAGSRLLVNVVLVSVAPLVPLLLFEYSVIDLLQRVAGRFL